VPARVVPPGNNGPMGTCVLIPGGGGDAWEWHRLVPELEALGHQALPVDLPAGDDSAGWNEYADAVVAAIGGRTDIVLVAESLGGFTAPIVCTRIPVDLLVLLNGMIPEPGETASAWGANTRRKEAEREYFASIGLPPEAADDDHLVYYHDVPAELEAEAVRRDPAQSWTPMEQPWPLDAWPDVPTRVLAGRDDPFLPAAFQRRVAGERLGIEVDEIPGGHMVAMSRPRQLAERLERYRADLEPGSR
jgi:pimeloyl-ACP methyl ester carboxylesterase